MTPAIPWKSVEMTETCMPRKKQPAMCLFLTTDGCVELQSTF